MYVECDVTLPSLITTIPQIEASAIATEASATPSTQTDGSLLFAKEMSREMSVESNSSRGADESETRYANCCAQPWTRPRMMWYWKPFTMCVCVVIMWTVHVINHTYSYLHTHKHGSRKSRARKSRQVRKQTQPVPADLLNLITKHNEQEPTVLSSSTPNSTFSDPETDALSNCTNTSMEDNSPAEQRKKSVSRTSRKNSFEKMAGVGGGNMGITKDSGGGGPATMSTCKPSVRSKSHILNEIEPVQRQSTGTYAASGSSSTSSFGSSFTTGVPSSASVPTCNSTVPSSSSSSSSVVSSAKVRIANAIEQKVKHERTTASATVKSEGIVYYYWFTFIVSN